MDRNKEMSIRGILILLGAILVLYAFYSFYLIASPILDAVLNGEFPPSLSLIDFQGSILLLILGMILFFIGHHWESSFKSLAISFVGIASLLMTLSIFAYAFNTSSVEISDSIQPSLDILIAQSIGTALETQLSEYENTQVTLLLSTSQETKKIYVSNITPEDAAQISDALGIVGLNSEQQISFSKFLIDSMYTNIQETSPELIDTPFPLSSLAEAGESNGLDPELITSDLVDLLTNLNEANPEAYITILLLENEETKTIVLGELSNKDIDLIWLNFGLDEKGISQETKEFYITLILGVTAKELENTQVEDIALPVASLASQIPDEIEGLLSYDIATDNLTQKAQIIEEIREDCVNVETQGLDQVCNMILLSDYNYLMENIDTIPTLTGVEIPQEIVQTLEPFSSTEKIATNLEEKTNYWKTFLFLSIFCFILAHLIYYAHFKIFKRELIPAHIPYFIAKHNLIHLIIPFMFLLLIYYLLISGTLLEYISELLPKDLGVDISFLFDIAIFQVLIDIFSKAVFLNLIYIIISILVFAGWYFLLKKKVKMYEEPPKKEVSQTE